MTSARLASVRDGTAHAPARVLVYSCAYADCDHAFGPLAATPNTRFLRFGDGRRGWSRTWIYFCGRAWSVSWPR